MFMVIYVLISSLIPPLPIDENRVNVTVDVPSHQIFGSQNSITINTSINFLSTDLSESLYIYRSVGSLVLVTFKDISYINN